MLDLLLTPISFILTLGLLVTVHEYGHFQVAKWCGVKVLKFSIGFGKPLWRKKIGRDQTEFILAAIPLGGYVKMLDERESDQTIVTVLPEQDLARAFNRQSVQKRIVIVLAGPLANLLLAIALYFLLLMQGVVGMKPLLGKVNEHTPAAMAQMQMGETIQKVDGKEIATWQDARWQLLNASLKKTQVDIQTIDEQQAIQHHQLDLSKVNRGDYNHDILDQLGLRTYQSKSPPLIGEVIKNGRAEVAGLKVNDLVLSINHHPVTVWGNFVEEIRRQPNVALEVIVLRARETITISLTPEAANEGGKIIGRIGAGVKLTQADLDKIFVTTHYSTWESLLKATEKTWETSIFSLKMLGRMLTGKSSWKAMSGPVTIASYAGQSAHMGLKSFIGFLALISISIGVLNLLPVPVLDGGHFMYYVIEIFTGKPVSDSIMIIGQKVGFTLLALMMFLALYNDINRLITG